MGPSSGSLAQPVNQGSPSPGTSPVPDPAAVASGAPEHAATSNNHGSEASHSFMEQQQQQRSRTSSLPLSLAGRVRSTTYRLQDRPADDEDTPEDLLLLRNNSLTGEAAVAAAAVIEEASGSERESDGFDWQPGSPDLRQSLLQRSHHSQHKQRQHSSSRGKHSNLSGQQHGHQHQHGHRTHGSIFGAGLLSSLFWGHGSHTEQQQHDAEDHLDSAAATADLLESGGSLTFAANSFAGSHTRQQESASASAAAVAASTLGLPAATAGSNGLGQLFPPAGPTAAAAAGPPEAPPAFRIFSEPPASMSTLSSRAGSAAAAGAQSRQLNEDVFNGVLGDVSEGASGRGGSTRPRAQSAACLGQKPMSKGKRMWQGAAQKVIAMQHITSSYRPGALQGLDVKRHCYDSWFSALHTEVSVTVVDYNKDQVEVASDITNAMLPEVLKVARPEWSKVRWINVQGLSWDVITTLAVAFDLHPLSVEDIVHIPQRIKADYYPEYLYASVIMLSVDHPSHLSDSLQQQQQQQQSVPTAAAAAAATAAAGSNRMPLRRSSSIATPQPHPRVRDSGSAAQGAGEGVGAAGGVSMPTEGVPFGGTMSRMLRTRLFGAEGTKKIKMERRAAASDCPAALQPMQPMVEQASIFLFRDGTLITMFQSVDNDTIARRLMSKLEGFRSLLTDSQDASYLFNAVLDAVVDHTLPLVQVYSSRIASLESRVLLDSRPQASLTKELHLLSNDLKLLRRTLVPTQHLVHKLQSTHDKDNNQGFLSPLTVLYLSDVYDHISTVVEDMISLAEDAKDLIDLIFNTIAHNNNSSMQMLAVVSTIFLPITFLAGVYGTNFDQWFPEIHWQYGYMYFWAACVFITVGFSALLQRWHMFDYSGSQAV